MSGSRTRVPDFGSRSARKKQKTAEVHVKTVHLPRLNTITGGQMHLQE